MYKSSEDVGYGRHTNFQLSRAGLTGKGIALDCKSQGVLNKEF